MIKRVREWVLRLYDKFRASKADDWLATYGWVLGGLAVNVALSDGSMEWRMIVIGIGVAILVNFWYELRGTPEGKSSRDAKLRRYVTAFVVGIAGVEGAHKLIRVLEALVGL